VLVSVDECVNDCANVDECVQEGLVTVLISIDKCAGECVAR
jgi:lipoate synthase